MQQDRYLHLSCNTLLDRSFQVYGRVAVATLQGDFAVDAEDVATVKTAIVPHAVATTVTGVEERAGEQIVVSVAEVLLLREVL